MAITMKARVLGMTKFKDSIEGVAYDQTKLKVEMSMSERSGNSVGCDATDMIYGKAENFDKLFATGVKFPCMCDLEVNPTTKGFEVEFCKPVVQQQAAKV